MTPPLRRLDLIERLPLNEKIPLKAKQLEMSASAQRQIRTYLRDHQSMVDFPSDWQWVWLVQHSADGYNGTLPKRISKLHKQQCGTFLSQQTQSDLGELAKRLLPKPQECLFDFNATLDWEAGLYADSGSCFLTYKTSAMDLLRKGSGRAMRRYSLEGDPQGRVLLVPVEHGLIVCNCYESNGSFRIETYTGLLADYLGLAYHPMQQVWNKAFGDYSFYADSRHGYLVGEPEVIAAVPEHDTYLLHLG